MRPTVACMNRRISALFLALLCAGAAPCGAQAIDSPATLEALTAEIEAATGTRRWADAILLGQKALAIEEATKGLNDPEVGGTLMLIAGWMRQLDRNADAEPLLRRSLQIFEQNYGKAAVIQQYNSIAGNPFRGFQFHNCFFEFNNYSKANRFSISASNNLAATLEALGRLDDANSLYTRTLDTMEQRYGPTHRLTAISTNNLAFNLARQGRYQDAQPLYDRALKIGRATMDNDDREQRRQQPDGAGPLPAS